MITEERLKELLKQGAKVYDVFKGDIYLVDLTMAKYYDVPKYIDYKNNYYSCFITRHIEDLFETKEEARWYLEFGNITRTETLKLPTWEEFEKMEEFLFDDMYGSACVIHSGENKDGIYLESVRYIYKFDYSYNGYIEACRLAKKLFLGESDENNKGI